MEVMNRHGGDEQLLCVVFAADARSLERLRTPELLPLGSRIRRRLYTFMLTRLTATHTQAYITEPGAVKKILEHLGPSTEPLPRARARDPTGQESFDFDAA
jgi:hypothetical protein